MRDYYPILSRAVAALEPNNEEARLRLFERARQMVIDGFRNEPARWTKETATRELAEFDAAARRVEFENARRTTRGQIQLDSRERQDIRDQGPREGTAVRARPLPRGVMWAAVAFGVFCLTGVVYFAWDFQAPPRKSGFSSGVSPQAVTAPSRSLPGDDLDPGIDGGSSAVGLPYYFWRQAVYYRSVQSPGTIIIDRSQRFLYLVQPQVRAIRYGIGVGGECNVGAGLYRIASKSQWPEWTPSPELLKRRRYPDRVPGGPGNPLGAYAMYFEGGMVAIHGTNAPRSIGQAPDVGCFRVINDDIVDLEKRVPIGTAVVVQN